MPGMDSDGAQRFVIGWLAAWNDHDVEAVLAHFAEDVVFSSPFAARFWAATASSGARRRCATTG